MSWVKSRNLSASNIFLSKLQAWPGGTKLMGIGDSPFKPANCGAPCNRCPTCTSSLPHSSAFRCKARNFSFAAFRSACAFPMAAYCSSVVTCSPTPEGCAQMITQNLSTDFPFCSPSRGSIISFFQRRGLISLLPLSTNRFDAPNVQGVAECHLIWDSPVVLDTFPLPNAPSNRRPAIAENAYRLGGREHQDTV